LWGHEGEVVWDIVKENGTLYSFSYSGNYSIVGDHQDLGQLSLYFNRSLINQVADLSGPPFS
jgi:hypothetical protein